jgi:hypothetical protein
MRHDHAYNTVSRQRLKTINRLDCIEPFTCFLACAVLADLGSWG